MTPTSEEQHSAQAPDRWPQTQALILLAFHADADFAALASLELLERLNNMPTIPLVNDDGRRKIIRRG